MAKVRDSGMPEEAFWESLFDVPLILDSFGVRADIGDVIEFGCGYGTFTIPVRTESAASSMLWTSTRRWYET